LRKTEATSKALNWNSQRQYLKSNLQESSTLTLVLKQESYSVIPQSSSSSSSFDGLGESPVPASNVVVSLSVSFLVYLRLVFWMVDGDTTVLGLTL
jgi:hypothetical protein